VRKGAESSDLAKRWDIAMGATTVSVAKPVLHGYPSRLAS
jgi:hypothetical protein